MFGIARRKSHRQLVREELGESLDHFVQAATHVARGAGATVGPKVNTARARVTPAAGRMKTAASSGWGSTIAALAPLATAATEGARQAGSATRNAKADNAKALQKNAKALQKNAKVLQKKSSKIKGKKTDGNRSKLGTLLVVGAAVGAAGAMVLRRRKQQQWDQYDPSRPIGTDERPAVDSMVAAPVASDYGTGATRTETSTATGTGTGGPLLSEPAGDQTSSAMHSPTVARMAGNTAPDATNGLNTGAGTSGRS